MHIWVKFQGNYGPHTNWNNMQCDAQQHSHNRTALKKLFDLTIFLLAALILNFQSNRTHREKQTERERERNKLGQKHSEMVEIMHPLRER